MGKGISVGFAVLVKLRYHFCDVNVYSGSH